MISVENISLGIKLYALIISIVGAFWSTKRLSRFWKTRHLRKVWGIKDGDYVVIVCSELDEPDERQNIEPREFIYNMKYGDVDAYFEVMITLLRLFPRIKLRVLSAGEAEKTRVDLANHLILIGGPDYNEMTKRILKKGITQYSYRSPYVEEQSSNYPDEIVIYHLSTNKEFCEFTDERDYGYFERVINPNNPESQIVLIGGCHTIGVTAAVKAFSMAESEQGEIPRVVLANAKMVSKKISRKSEFSVLVAAERVGQTINVPIVRDENITNKVRL
jgi:hypothetical protein